MPWRRQLTILFIVFNPAGEVEILNLLKGEVISLSKEELKLLAIVYGVVYVGLVLFRREFLLNSFDRDLSFLLTGGSAQWSFWLYVLCGFSIAIGVIMAGPLLVFGFMVLPPLAARTLARGMGFVSVALIVDRYFHRGLGLLSFRAPGFAAGTDGCGVWLCGDFRRLCRAIDFAPKRRDRWADSMSLLLCAPVAAPSGQRRRLTHRRLGQGRSGWLRCATARTQTCVYPARIRCALWLRWRVNSSPKYRPTVMDLLRGSLQRELTQRQITVSFPEERDARLQFLPFDGVERRGQCAHGQLYWLVVAVGDPPLAYRWPFAVAGVVEMQLVRIDNRCGELAAADFQNGAALRCGEIG